MSLRQAALVAGIAYVTNPVTWAEFYAMPRLVADDPTRTLANLQAHQHLFGAVVLVYFITLLGDVVVAWGLYVLLEPVNRALALLMAWLQLVYAAMVLASVGALAVVYRLLFVPEYTRLDWAGTLPAQVRMLIGTYRATWDLGLVLFGLHLVLLGWLFVRSGYLARWLGWLLIADGCAWVIIELGMYVAPQAKLGFLGVFYVGELVLMVWLLWWGWKPREVREVTGFASRSPRPRSMPVRR